MVEISDSPRTVSNIARRIASATYVFFTTRQQNVPYAAGSIDKQIVKDLNLMSNHPRKLICSCYGPPRLHACLWSSRRWIRATAREATPQKSSEPTSICHRCSHAKRAQLERQVLAVNSATTRNTRVQRATYQSKQETGQQAATRRIKEYAMIRRTLIA